MSKKVEVKPIKIEWGMKQEMSSLILLLRDGNYEGQKFATERLMEIADQIDEFNKN
jgi:DNA polymerase IIIc chi subunit